MTERWLMLAVLFAGQHLIDARSEFAWEFLGNCKADSKEQLVYLENTTWGMVGPGAFECNISVVFAKDIQNMKAIVDTYTCQRIDGTDCEKFLPMSFPDLCKMIGEKGQLWSSFVENLKPPISCPFKKGAYVANRVVIDMELIQKFFANSNLNMPGSFKAHIRMSNGNKNLGCIKGISRIVQVRSRKTAKPKH